MNEHKTATDYRKIGVVSAKKRDVKEAIASYRQAIALEAEQPDWVYVTLVQLLQSAEQIDEAVSFGKMGIKLHPKQAEIYRSLGGAFNKKGDVKEAIASYRQAIALEAEQPGWVYVTLVQLLQSAGQIDEAVSFGKMGVKLHPKQGNIYRSLGAALHKKGYIKGAIESYRQAIALEAEQPGWVYATLVQLLQSAEQIDEAINFGRLGIKLHPKQAEIYRSLGAVLHKKGDVKGTIESYRQAIALEAKQPSWFYLSIVEHLQSGEKLDEAIALVRKGLELYPQKVELLALEKSLQEKSVRQVSRAGKPKQHEQKNLKSARKLKIALVTPNVLHLDKSCITSRNFYGLAKNLARFGHRVDIAHLKASIGDKQEKWSVAQHFLDEGIRSLEVPEPEWQHQTEFNCRALQDACLILDFLKRRKYDLVHLPVESGLAYYYLQAKKLNSIDGPSYVCVHVSHPTLARFLRGLRSLNSYEDLLVFYMEKRCIEMADRVIAGSKSVVDWMQEYGYELDDERICLDPGPTLDAPVGLAWRQAEPISVRNVESLVFAGRLHRSKCLTAFCWALDILVERGKLPEEVTFLDSKDPEFPVEGKVDWGSKEWPFPWEVREDVSREDMLLALMKPGALAIIPNSFEGSLLTVRECIAYDIPFLAIDDEDLPDLVAKEDCCHVAVQSHHLALADRLEEFMTRGFHPLPPNSIVPKNNRKIWLAWHERFAEENKNIPAPTRSFLPSATSLSSQPQVSVCITQYDSPETLHITLKSLLQQTWSDFEAIVLDDGSTEKAEDYLKEISSTDERIRVICRDSLPSGTANTNTNFARGRYIFFTDDRYHAKPQQLETFLSVVRWTEGDILTCFSDNYHGDGQLTRESIAPIRHLSIGGNLIYAFLMNDFVCSNCFMKREVWEKLEVFTWQNEEQTKYLELSIGAALMGFSVEVIPESLCYYRLDRDDLKRFELNGKGQFAGIFGRELDCGFSDPKTLPLVSIAYSLFLSKIQRKTTGGKKL